MKPITMSFASKSQLFNKIVVRCISNEAFDYNYLEQSRLPTNIFEKSLPKLPIPPLNDTCYRYLESLRPLIPDDASFNAVRKKVEYFEGGVGYQLNKELIENDKKNSHTSYISEPWFDMYLSSRKPLPIHFNPFLAWKQDPSFDKYGPPIRATNYIISALRFRRSLLENVLVPEIFHMNPKKSNTDLYRKVIKMSPSRIAWYVSAAFKAFPLDMSQYGSLFSSTRIPRRSKDVLQKFPDSKHIVILCRGNFYAIDVLDNEGNIKSPQEIYSAISYVWTNTKTFDEHSISILTTLDRDEWATHREELISDPQNAKNLHAIDSAIFLVCLDDDVDFLSKTDEDPFVQHSHNFLHGNNIKTPRRPINRWFDKSFSLIFTQDGQCGINFEHSWGDGVAVLRFFNEVYKDSANRKFLEFGTENAENQHLPIVPLTFTLNDNLIDVIKKSRVEYQKWTNSLEISYIKYDRINRNYFKKFKLSPDSMFQLAFQMAYYKISMGKTPVTYEAASTAAFKHGRTETVRPATIQTQKACFMIHSMERQYSNEELMTALRDCSNKHNELTKNAAMGKGFDRHLFALKYLAEKRQDKMPGIFVDPSYAYANHFTLSSSTLHGECHEGGGFGPVVNDGFGLGYGFFGPSLGVFCSNYRQLNSGKAFLQALEKSLDQIADILEASTPNDE